jgi:hypothetical protein
MNETLYVGQPIKVSIACTIDGAAMSTALSAVIDYLKPDGTEGSWPAVIDNGAGTVSCNVTAEEIDQAGPWILQPVVSLPGNMTLPGTSVQMTIRARFR